MTNNVTYKHIISFGCMCSTALFLRKNGFRSESTIFDWLSSSLKANLKMLDDNFEHILDKEYLCQPYPDFPHIIDNKYYDVSLNHMFDEYKTFESQIKSVRKYCDKRIARFKKALEEGKNLLVYYSRDQEECEWISSNEKHLRDYCQKYGFDWLFITNYELSPEFGFPHFVVPINNIHKPYGGGVSFPFENVEPIVNFLDGRFDNLQKKQNLAHREKKHWFKKIIRRLNKKSGIKLKI